MEQTVIKDSFSGINQSSQQDLGNFIVLKVWSKEFWFSNNNL